MTAQLGSDVEGRTLASGRVKEAFLAYGFLLPSALVFAAFFFYPLGRLVWFSLNRQDRFGRGLTYEGFGQWGDVLSSTDFLDGLKHTLLFVLYTVPLGLVLGVLLAVAANRKIRGIKFFHTVFSSTIATSVAVASVVFVVLINPKVGYLADTWVAQFFDLSDPDAALRGVALSSVWQNLGLTFIIVLAGLQAVPEELMEAAKLDGYNSVQRFFRITLPLISPTLMFLVVVLVVFGFQAFAQVELLTNGTPAGRTETLVFKIFTDSQDPAKLGPSSVMALGLFVLTVVVSAFQFIILSRRVHYGN